MATSVVFPRVQFFADNGRLLIGGRIHTFIAGTSSRAPTYKDAARAQPNTNPIILDGRAEASIYLAEGVEYKFVVEDSNGALIMTQEPVYGAIWPNAEDWPSDATLAYQYMLEAKAAASAIGPIKFYDTYAQADNDLPNLSEDDLVEIAQDENKNGARTRYRVESGALVFVVSLGRPFELTSVMDFSAVGDGITDDTLAVQAAVAHCSANNDQLYWPAGTYLINANLPDFWGVMHTGPGVIKRGASAFFVTPRNGQENFLYVSAAAGDSAYDGLSAGFPFSQTQLAFDALASKGHLSGTWRVHHSAGTYTGNARLGPGNDAGTDPNVDTYRFNGVTQDNFIVIEGPDVGYDPLSNPWPLPSATFDNADNIGVGLQLRNVRVLIKNLKFRSYVGGSSAGIQGEGCHIRTENVHTAGCTAGIVSYRGRLEVKGGLIYGTETKQFTGIISQFLNKHEIGEQGAGGIGRGPKISYCNIGLMAQEGATGHSDYVQYEDCVEGIRVTVNSRVNYTDSNFKRCTRAVRCDANSVIFYGNPDYNDGTADACGENVIIQQGGVDVLKNNRGNSGVATDYLGSSVTVTGTTTSIAILEKILPRGLFAPQISTVRKPQHIRITAFGSISGTAGLKQFKVRLGGVNLGSINNAPSDSDSFKVTCEVVFLSPTSQKGGVTYLPHISSPRSSYGSTAIDMRASDVPLRFEVQLTNVADSVTIDHCVIEVYG